MFFKKNRRKKIIKAFEGYIDQDVMENLLDNENNGEYYLEHKLKMIKYSYQIIKFNDMHFEDLSFIIKKALNEINKYNITIGDFFGTYLIIYFPVVNKIENKKIADILLSILDNNIKLIYGVTSGAIGNVGNDLLQSYGPILIDMEKILLNLNDVNYGSIQEVNNI